MDVVRVLIAPSALFLFTVVFVWSWHRLRLLKQPDPDEDLVIRPNRRIE